MGGRLLDGSGAPEILADLGIQTGRIAAIGDLAQAEAKTVINANECYLCPGFIDVHSHSDTALLSHPAASSKIYQGITTEIVGNCGSSPAPLDKPTEEADDPAGRTYQSLADYFQLLEQAAPAPNVAVLVGHGRLRKCVLGYAARPATTDEIQSMANLLRESLAAGAWGLSSGLIYTPSKWASSAELIALAKVVGSQAGIYASHMRSEGTELLAAIQEIIALSRAANVRVQISHLKTNGQANWHLIDAALELIQTARRQGVALAADRYPYTLSCTDLDIILPAWATSGGPEAILERLRDPRLRAQLKKEIFARSSPAHIVIASTSQAPYRGQALCQVAAQLQLDPAAAALQLLDLDELKTTAFFQGMSAENMWRILAEPYVMLGTDAALQPAPGSSSQAFPHPRAYGAFPRFLRAALDKKTVPLAEAVRKMTAWPAEHFRLPDRGTLRIGNWADLVLFDPQRLSDRATFSDPQQLAQGIEWVLVNGVITLTPQGLSGQRAGRVLRH